MKQNSLLGKSRKIQGCKMGNILGLMEKEFPASALEGRAKSETSRARVFTVNNTLLTMVLTATQQDKTLKNSVGLYYMGHQKHKQQALNELGQQAQKQKELDQAREDKKKAGRPKAYAVRLPKSLEKDIPLNTAAYSKARERVPVELAQGLSKASRIENAQGPYTHWHGYRVLIGDGTCVQMQDTKSLGKDYEVKHNGVGSEGYPQGLLEVLIERGQLYNFKLSNRHVSELALFHEMMDEVPPNTMVLLDDLYNCYEIIAKCIRTGIELVVPAKWERNDEVAEVIAEGDEIIRIEAPRGRSKWVESKEGAKTLLIRRITCKSPDGGDYILNTTLLDKKISKEEVQLLYLGRWDIEISIREIKTIMDVNVLRS